MNLTKPEQNRTRWEFLSYLMCFPGLWLIYHLVSLGLEYNSQELTMYEFKTLRNIFYQISVVLGVFLGICIMIIHNLNIRSNNKYSNFERWAKKLTSVYVINILLTTYSYQISQIAINLYKNILHIQ